MNAGRLSLPQRHDHSFGLDRPNAAERKTLWVTLLTATFMVVEIGAGTVYGSMALLADGLHMGTHAIALGIALGAYVYARRRAHDPRLSFGTGKVNALGGFAGAVSLALFAIIMAAESLERVLDPVAIEFDQAIAVAAVGLVVNLASLWLLGAKPASHPGHGHGHGHEHPDHNLRSAYLHVAADALTSLAAIVALVGGKLFGLTWLDPAMGVLGAVLVARWSWGLARESGGVLLDRQAPPSIAERVRESLEAGGDGEVVDLHVWSIGPGRWASCVTVVGTNTSWHYKERIPSELGLCHVTVEVALPSR